jgi:hypothetical protein
MTEVDGTVILLPRKSKRMLCYFNDTFHNNFTPYQFHVAKMALYVETSVLLSFEICVKAVLKVLKIGVLPIILHQVSFTFKALNLIIVVWYKVHKSKGRTLFVVYF